MGVPYAPLIQQAARQYKIPPSVLAGLIDTESGFDPNSVSSAGARGLTQFMPGTAKSYGVQFGSSPAAVRTQIFGAARYLAEGGYHQDPGKALSGYVAGPAGGRQQWYVDRVLSASRKPQFQALNRGGLGQALAAPTAGRTATATVTRNVELPGGSGTGIADLLGELGQQRPAPQVSLPTAPAFAAGPRLAGGAIPQLPVLGPAMAKSGVDEALRELEGQDRPAQQIPVSGSATATGPGGQPTAHASLRSAYRFPLPNVASIGRTDRGQDMEAAKPYSKTVALGDGVIVRAGIGFPGIVLKLDRPFAGHQLVFYGHNSASYVKPGQRVRAGQVVGQTGQPANGAGGPAHTEIGFTNDPDQIPASQGPGHWAPTGQAFHNLLTKLRPDLYR